MTVGTSWTNPTGATLDLANGATVTETNWDALVSDVNRLGGSAGAQKTGHFGIVPVNDGNLTGTPTLDLSGGNVRYGTLTGNVTGLTLSNPVAGVLYVLHLKQGGAGSFTVAWPASVKWGDAGAPTLSTSVGDTDVIALRRDPAGGDFYYGFASLGFVLA